MFDKNFSPEATQSGVRDGNRVIGYSHIIRELDKGRFDDCIPTALRLLACIQEAKTSGWIQLPVEKEIILWRWLVVTVFMIQQEEKNGTADVPNDEGGVDRAVIYRGAHGGMGIYPGPERFCLANHVESVAIEKYGTAQGLDLALGMYQKMLSASPGEGFILSDFGQQAFEMLHDMLIEQFNTEGMPDMPVMH